MTALAPQPDTYARSVAMVPTDRLEALARQIAKEQADPSLTRSQRRFVVDLLAPIADAIWAELERRKAGQAA